MVPQPLQMASLSVQSGYHATMSSVPKCISIWLTPDPTQHSNDTCPLCRHQLFSVTQSLLADLQDPHSRISILLDIWHATSALDNLDLNRGVIEMMARWVSNAFHMHGSSASHSIGTLAAASVYMASHATGDPRSLEAISQGLAVAGVAVIGTANIRRTYMVLYRYRRELLPERALTRATGQTSDTIDAFLPSPN